MESIKEDLFTAVNACIAGGQRILEVYNSSDFDISLKDDDSPLTKADLAANKEIMSYLTSTPHEVISEENKALPYAARKNWKSLWIVDPLDGTKEFIKRNGEFTVNIALLVEGKLQLGVIYVPVTRKLYFGNVEEQSAMIIEDVKDVFSSGEQILAKAKEIKASESVNEIRVVGSKSHMNDETRNYVDRLRSQSEMDVTVLSRGSSLKLCMIAEGEADVYPRYAPTMEWDTAAGQAICEAAGAEVLQKDSGEPLQYNKEDLLNPHFIVKRVGSNL